MSNDQQSVPASRSAECLELLQGLTPEQCEAVTYVEGPQLVLAGPGSGKTRVVTHRIAYMLRQGIPGQQIVALTFTNKAADEMRQRVEQLAPGGRVWIGTFHRFCAQLLRRYAPLVGLKENFSICDTDDSHKLLREAIREADVELTRTAPGRIAAAISWAKNELITPEQYEPAGQDPLGALVREIYPEYQRILLNANVVDFDDLLMHVAQLLSQHEELRRSLDARYRYIMVDEYQDTNLAQYMIVRGLSEEYANLSVTGDPDQSIYGWRGATIRNILEFERSFSNVQVVRLEENFRSTPAILRSADQLIANNLRRKAKTLWTRNPEGVRVRLVIFPSGRAEADSLAARIANEVSAGRRRYRDFVVLYRTNALSRAIERSFRALSLPYQIIHGLEFYQRKEIKDILAYLHLVNNPANDAAFLRIVNTPPRRIGKTTLQRLATGARRRGMSLFDAARQADQIEALSKRAVTALGKFVAMIDSMQLSSGDTVERAMGSVLHFTGYCQWLELSESEQEQQRLENLDELLSDAREFDESPLGESGLEGFLEQASLVADVDDWGVELDCVTMMTLHAAKGLEFPVVFIVGIEDDMLPHFRSKDEPDQFEEERRLFFVGITRAQEELHLSTARSRLLRGDNEPRAPSPFLLELPSEEMEIVGESEPCDFDDDWEIEWDDYDDVLDEAISPTGDEAIGVDEAVGEETFRDEPGDRSGAIGREDRPVDETHGKRAAKTPRIVTAADLTEPAGGGVACSPDQFRQAMVVIHPEYGVGRIVSLGGQGAKRTATVQFSEEMGIRSFRLAFSPLRPLKR